MDAQTLRAAMQETYASDEKLRLYLPHLEAAMIAAEVDNPKRAAAFCAQIGHETAGLRYMAEIATSHPDWNWDRTRYRGRGAIQLTWRSNYAAFGAWCKKQGYVENADLFVDQPELVEQPRWGFLAASWYWLNGGPRPGQINSFADQGDIYAVSKCVNGWRDPPNGWPDREKRWKNCLRLGESIVVTKGVPVSAPPMVEDDQTANSPNSSQRWGAIIRLFVLHTQEGNGNAQSLTNYLKDPSSQVSYHYSIDNDRCIALVDTDRYSWSVLDANSYTLNACFAGSRAAMSTQEWMDRFSRAIDMAAWLFVRDGRKYGVDLRVLNWDEIGAGLKGGTDHYGITKGLGIGNHTDVGPNFPWGYYIDRIDYHASGGVTPAPIVNEIDEKAKVSPWLGKRITDGENATPDGVGRYAEFENGRVYWSPATGAHPVPNSLFESWGEYGWEQGPLGYPVTDHTALNGPDGNCWGDVQGFERGTLYRKVGQPGYYVHGAIGSRWFRSGFENGPLGWPTSNEVEFDEGRYQEFEYGRIFWAPRGTVALVTKGDFDEPLHDNA